MTLHGRVKLGSRDAQRTREIGLRQLAPPVEVDEGGLLDGGGGVGAEVGEEGEQGGGR